MIIVLLAFFAVLTFIAWLVLPTKKARIIVGSLASLGLMLTVAAMTLNFTNQFGMREVQTSEIKQIYSAGDPRMAPGVMIAEPVGSEKKHYVMVYRDAETDEKPVAHFKPDQKKMLEAAKRHASYEQKNTYKQAEVEIKTTRLEWANDFAKFLFDTSGQSHAIVKQEANVRIPADWMVLTQAEAQKLMSNAR